MILISSISKVLLGTVIILSGKYQKTINLRCSVAGKCSAKVIIMNNARLMKAMWSSESTLRIPNTIHQLQTQDHIN